MPVRMALLAGMGRLPRIPRIKVCPRRLSAARYNPKTHGVAKQLPSYSRWRVAIYRRLKKRGKPDKVARIAAARKLLLIAHAIYNSGESFRAPNANVKEFRRNSQAAQHVEQPLTTHSIQHLTPSLTNS